LKNCSKFLLFLTGILLAISLTILSAAALAQTQMVLVTTDRHAAAAVRVMGRRVPPNCTRKRSLLPPGGNRRKCKNILSGAGDLLAAVMRQFPKAI